MNSNTVALESFVNVSIRLRLYIKANNNNMKNWGAVTVVTL